MDFSLNEEQLTIRNTCREFAEQEIKTIAEKLDTAGTFPGSSGTGRTTLGVWSHRSWGWL